MTLEELLKLKAQTDVAVNRQEGQTLARREAYIARWRQVAPRLLMILECMLPRAVVKIKIKNVFEYKIIGTPDGGFTMSLDNGQSLVVINDQIQYVEKGPSFTKVIYSKSQGICDPMAVITRGSPTMRYLLMHWSELEPLFIDNIAANLKTWAQG